MYTCALMASLILLIIFYRGICVRFSSFARVWGSDVSAHTAMITLSLEDALRDPAATLGRVLSFVRRDDWEWEGRGEGGGGGGDDGNRPSPKKGGEERQRMAPTDDLVVVDRGGSFRALLERASLVLDGAFSSFAEVAGGVDVEAYQESVRDAFAREMERSSDLTAWPCPSFWEGADGNVIGGGDIAGANAHDIDDDGDDQTRVLRRISGEMAPNCADDDPFARCTVKKDRCEVKGDAKCNN